MSIEEVVRKEVKEAIREIVEEVKNTQFGPPADWPPFMNRKEVGIALGIGKDAVDALFHRRDFPAVAYSDTRAKVGRLALWKWINGEK